MPNTGRGGGISRKITQATDRKRLKKIATDLEVPQGQGLIIRTAGGGRAIEELQWDLNYLLKLWDAIKTASASHNGSFLIYQESSLVIRSIR